MKNLPFKLEKKNGTTLISQIVNGFRHAIEIGYYRPGDKLPPFRDIARESGACMIVVREAFKRLSAEGLVSLRRGVGTIVLDGDVKFWRGHIVIASMEVRENHLISAMTGALRQTLMKSGFLVSTVPFEATPGNCDYSHLETMLNSAVTMVVATSVTPELDSLLTHRKVPYIVFGNSQSANGCVQIDCSHAVGKFVKHCRRAKVGKVVEITVGSALAQVSQALGEAGIACEKWPIVSKGGIEEISVATMKAFYDRFEKNGRRWLPDVLYFNDNFASQSALAALLESGVKIPEDVRFVTWSNAGEGPFWRKSLTRIEIDPFEAGRVFAKYVLNFLNGKKIKKTVMISPVYVKGETF